MAIAKQTAPKSAKSAPNREKNPTSGKLSQWIGKSAANWTTDDLIKAFYSHDLSLVSLMHIGGDGWLKTLDFAPRDRAHLQDILLGGERADGSSIFAGMGIPTGQSDIVLRPRIESAFIDPFSTMPTLVLMCQHFGRDGKPLPESPDTILNNAYRHAMATTGVDLYALGEVEYYIAKRPDESDCYGSSDRGYHSASPFVFGEGLRRQALAILNDIGIPVKYGHSEVGYMSPTEDDPYVWEQHEIELALQPLPRAAEAVVVTQWVLRNLAHRNGMKCSFEPVVRKGHAGSGLHFHMSPVVKGKHLPVYRKEDELNDVSKWLIGGLVQQGGVLMAFGNRTESSFTRLTQAKEAPNSVTWGRYNRKALIRLPILVKDAKGRAIGHETIEYRLPDGSANPQLLLAGIAQALVFGKNAPDLDKWLEKTAANQHSGQTATVSVPKSFGEIANILEQHRSIYEKSNVFPAHLVDKLIENLRLKS